MCQSVPFQIKGRLRLVLDTGKLGFSLYNSSTLVLTEPNNRSSNKIQLNPFYVFQQVKINSGGWQGERSRK